MNTIIVLGNGFDLQVGLKSSFDDYFREFWRKVDSIPYVNNILDKALYSEWITLWHIYFKVLYEKKDWNSWMDVELEILNSLKGEFWEKVLLYCNEEYNLGKATDQNNLEYVHAEIIKRRYAKPFNVRLDGTKSRFYEILLDELKMFEKDFAKYLKHQVDDIVGREQYQKRQEELFKKLLDKTDTKYTLNGYSSSGGDAQSEVQILSFNYTKLSEKILESRKYLNVHGTIDNGPILGICGRSIPEDRIGHLDIFTKSHRIEMSMPGTMGKILKNSEDNNIIFYGCSFGEQDYTYYKILTDMRGAGKIYCCYTDYPDSAGGSVNRKNEHIAKYRSYFRKNYNEEYLSNLIHKNKLEAILID